MPALASPNDYIAARMFNMRPGPERAQAYANLAWWIENTRARPYLGVTRACFWRLWDPFHRCGKACRKETDREGAVWYHVDHPEWWRGHAGEWILTGHTYGVDADRLAGLAERYCAELLIGPDRSWYMPGSTTLVVFWGMPATNLWREAVRMMRQAGIKA